MMKYNEINEISTDYGHVVSYLYVGSKIGRRWGAAGSRYMTVDC